MWGKSQNENIFNNDGIANDISKLHIFTKCLTGLFSLIYS